MINNMKMVRLLTSGINYREAGEYEQALELLEQVYVKASNGGEAELLKDVGNNLSILYRLMSGRAARAGSLVQAERWSAKSVSVYSGPEMSQWLADGDAVSKRNYAHALLYAGQVRDAIDALEDSIRLQQGASLGDEYCHLAVAYMALGDTEKAQQYATKGMEILGAHEDALVARCFGYMVLASLERDTDRVQAKAYLEKADEIATSHKLRVRAEEIAYMRRSEGINVVRAVAGDLVAVRSYADRYVSMVGQTKPATTPILLMMGGYQGSGKTTVLRLLRQRMPLAIVSSDEIRNMLFEDGYKVSYLFEQLVRAIAVASVRTLVSRGVSVGIDAHLKPDQMQLIEKVLVDLGAHHQICRVLLVADEDTLVRRVEKRSGNEEAYRGTVVELRASMEKYGELDETAYDLVVDTTGEKAEMVERIVEKFGW